MRTALLAVCLAAGAVLGQSSRDIAVTDSEGLRVERSWAAPMMLSLPGEPPDLPPGVVWILEDTVSIPESVAFAEDYHTACIAHAQHAERVSCFNTNTGRERSVKWLTEENLETIGVSGVVDDSDGVYALLTRATGEPAKVRYVDPSSGYTYSSFSFPAGYDAVTARSIMCTQLIACFACASNGIDSLLINTFPDETVTIPDCCSAVYVDWENNVLLTCGDTARLYLGYPYHEVYSLTVDGSGGYHRIGGHRDFGMVIAAGGFDFRAAVDTDGVWQEVYHGTGTNQWFGELAISRDGETLFVTSHDYTDGYLTNEHRLIDLTTGEVIARRTSTGTGKYQNKMVAAHASYDGTLFAVASWGDEGNTEPEVRFYDRQLRMIGAIDTEGSPYAMDFYGEWGTAWGLVVTKAVHANAYGNGGRTYAFKLNSACYADFNNDEVVDSRDLLAYLNAWAAEHGRADCVVDSVIDTLDLLCYLNEWAAGC